MTAIPALTGELVAMGRKAGLDRVGICGAEPFVDTRNVIEERRRRGLHGGMQFTYRNPARSTDPARTLPGARALYVGARSYNRSPAPPARNTPAAAVARYSWTDHYEPLRQALGTVAARLRDEGWRAAVIADDNALVDRAAAVRAGLGWFGKNTNVLIPGAGSMFVLGSVVTDAPLAPDRPPPVPDGCGACQRCLHDCPTGALTGPGELDARRCLAWLLQAPGAFPVEHRRALGDRLYGCDECQTGCPVNRRADRDRPPPPAEAGARAALPVLEILEADDSRLERLVGRWYIPGREMRYVRRNALIVLGNVGDPGDARAGAALAGALADADPLIRSHAVWAARRLGRDDLLAAVRGDRDPAVAEELERAEV